MKLMENTMIELTATQVQSLNPMGSIPSRAVNPVTNEQFVLLTIAEYQRLKSVEYDDSPWTREELEAAAWEAGKSIGWEEMDEYDNLPEKP